MCLLIEGSFGFNKFNEAKQKLLLKALFVKLKHDQAAVRYVVLRSVLYHLVRTILDQKRGVLL